MKNNITIDEILDYLDEEVHPIVSPDNYNIYSELYDMILLYQEQELNKYPKENNIRRNIDLGFNLYCNSNTNAKEAFEKGFRFGITFMMSDKI